MHVIVRIGNGNYYTSAVFGTYKDSNEPYFFDLYYIVFNQDKTKLVKQPLFNPKRSPYLDKMVLMFDNDVNGYIIDDNNLGYVEFMTKELSLQCVAEGKIPDSIYNKCLELDRKVIFRPNREIKTEKDVEDFLLVTGWLHDAYISKLEERAAESLYLLFEGAWGCLVEVTLEDEVTYCADYDEWIGASIKIKDGYIYLVDDGEDVEINEITDDYCWFKSKTMKYHIIPG